MSNPPMRTFIGFLKSRNPRIALVSFCLLGAFEQISQAMTFDCVRGSYLTNFEPVPNCSGVDRLPDGNSFPFRTNSLGLRSTEFSPFPAPGVVRILFFGGSQSVEQNGVGIVSSLSKEFSLQLPAKKIEIINASDHGADVLRVFLSLPILLNAYHPHFVFLVDDFQAHGLQEGFEYVNAAELDSNGLVKALGYTNFFWPLPLSLSSKLFFATKERFVRGRTFLIAIRMAALQLRTRLGLWKIPGAHAGRSPFLEVHLRHVHAIKKAAEAAGAEFVVLNLFPNNWDPGEIFRESRGKKDAWYKAEHVASQLMPWYYSSKEDLRELEAVERAQYHYIDVSEEFFSGADMNNNYFKNDIHMNGAGIDLFGRRMAKKTVPIILKLERELLGKALGSK